MYMISFYSGNYSIFIIKYSTVHFFKVILSEFFIQKINELTAHKIIYVIYGINYENFHSKLLRI